MPRKPKRPIEDIVQEIDTKIEYHQKCIEALQQKKSNILNPQKVLSTKEIATLVKKSGLSVDEIAERLGVELTAEKNG